MKPNPNQAGEITQIAATQLVSRETQHPPFTVENSTTAPVFVSGPFLRLPRPDRLLARLRFQSQTTSIGEQCPDDILGAWNLHINGRVRRAGGPGRSSNWLIPTNTGLKVLKRYKPIIDHDWVVHEHSILQALAAADFPAPRLVAAGEATLIERDGGIFALFEAYEGYFHSHNNIFLPGMTQQFISAAGKTLAVLHLALRSFNPQGRNPNGFMESTGGRWRELDWYFSRLERCAASLRAISNGNTDSSHAITAGWLHEQLEKLDETLKHASLQRVIAHGDYGPYNLLFRRGSPVVVLDFELSRLDWRLTDFSSGLFYFTHGRTGFHWMKMRWFLDAYRSLAPVSTDEMQYLPLVWQFLTMRRFIVFAERALEGNQGAIQEAREHLKLLDWLIKHEGELRRL
jgi:Ser/Thr protein kinase RdoA (MazF antagonist)